VVPWIWMELGDWIYSFGSKSLGDCGKLERQEVSQFLFLHVSPWSGVNVDNLNGISSMILVLIPLCFKINYCCLLKKLLLWNLKFVIKYYFSVLFRFVLLIREDKQLIVWASNKYQAICGPNILFSLITMLIF